LVISVLSLSGGAEILLFWKIKFMINNGIDKMLQYNHCYLSNSLVGFVRYTLIRFCFWRGASCL